MLNHTTDYIVEQLMEICIQVLMPGLVGEAAEREEKTRRQSKKENGDRKQTEHRSKGGGQGNVAAGPVAHRTKASNVSGQCLVIVRQVVSTYVGTC